MRLLQGRHAALHIPLVARLYILQKGGDTSIHSFFFQLLESAFGARLGRGGEEYLQHRVRKHHRGHIPPVRHQSRRAAKCPLFVEQGRTHLGQSRDF